MKKQAEDWLSAAEDDLRLIEKIIADESLTNMVAFHSQQAIEKSLKSVLEEYESKVPRIHNIIKLKEMTEKYIDFQADKKTLEQVNEIYSEARYPSDIGLVPSGKPSIELAKKFYLFAIYVRNEISLAYRTGHPKAQKGETPRG
jgi:HEPN domain-containing protein